MLCPKCSKENPEGSQFCSFCGSSFAVQQPVTPVEPVAPVQQQAPQPVYQQPKSGLSNGQKATIIVLLVMLVGALSLLLLFGKKDGNSLLGKGSKDDTRTIMIYLEGSNLESDSGIATTDLLSLDATKIDLDKTNILVYTGGTKEWHNDFVKNDENAIFLFTKDGYEKVKTYDKLNMGDPNTLSEFMNYAYDNYPAGHYNLILDDHGAGIAGAIFDDFTNDNLTLEDFGIAMKNSPFNEKNKMDTVLFRTCLNGTLEVASIFVPYAEYIVFSEEISNGSPIEPVLDFIHTVNCSADGIEFGKQYIDRYQKMMDVIDAFGVNPVTYSIVDLSKVDEIVNKLNSFVKDIDIKASYNGIARLRANSYQYGKAQTSIYDTIDLYSFVKGLSSFSKGNSDDLLSLIKEAVVYNKTNLKESNGISIYFPYNGGTNISQFLRVYKGFKKFDGYRTFINTFYSTQSTASSFAFDFTKNKASIAKDGKEVSIQLTPEQYKNLSYVVYTVFERVPDHPKYFSIIYNSNDVDISDTGLVTTKIADNLIQDKEQDTGKYYFLPVFHRINDGVETRYVNGIVKNPNEKYLANNYSRNVKLQVSYKDDKPFFASALVSSDGDERVEGMILDFKTYSKIEIPVYHYKIMDDKGKFLGNIESSSSFLLYQGDADKFELRRASIDNGDYYVLFAIADTNNEVNFANPIKVGG